MSSVTPQPIAVDLDVFKLQTADAVVDRDDVERALYALTGWQKPQRLVDAALDVVDSYARAVRLGRVVPARGGHLVVRGSVAAPCTRAHLDEHECPVAVDPCAHGCRDAADELTRLGQELEQVSVTPVTYRDTRALDQAARDVEPGKRVRTGVRNEPAMTPDELRAVDPRHLDQLTPAQLNARRVLDAGEQACSTCGETKPLADFYRDKARLTGHASRCKSCANEASSARRRGKRESPRHTPL